MRQKDFETSAVVVSVKNKLMELNVDELKTESETFQAVKQSINAQQIASSILEGVRDERQQQLLWNIFKDYSFDISQVHSRLVKQNSIIYKNVKILLSLKKN